MTVTILRGDCRSMMRTLEPESIHCVVTSPPYWGLRDYGVDGQIGLEPDYREFVAKMVDVFREVHRVLRPDGTVFLNLGDSYFGGGGGGGSKGSKQQTNTGSLIPGHTRAGARRAAACDTPGKEPEGYLTNDCLSVDHGAAPHLVSPETMRRESSPQHPAERRQSGRPSECPLCGCSLQDCVPVSARRVGCTCDTAGGGSVDRMIGKGASGSAYIDFATASLKPKDLCGIPWRVAFALQDDGWYLRQDIVWAKPNPMPESVTDRCTKSHEYMFLMSKSERYYFDQEAIAEPVSAASIDRLSQPTLDEQRGSERVPGKTNGTMKAVGKRPPTLETKLSGTYSADAGRHDGGQHRSGGFVKRSGNKARKDATERGCPASGDAGSVPWEGVTRNKRSVWTVTTQPFKDAHFATFPPALIEPCILAGCPRGGTVLDPFLGAGTTGLVADRLGRNCIGIELNPAYADMAERRIRSDAGLFASVELKEAAE